MTDMVAHKNIAALLTSRLATAITAIVAGAATNAVAIVGATLQRSACGGPNNAAIELFFQATLAAGKTLSLGTVKVQDSADGVNWADFQTYPDPGVVATGPAGGGTVSGQVQIQGLFGGARDYLRLVFTPTLSAANTDTATVLGALMLAGHRILPAAA